MAEASKRAGRQQRRSAGRAAGGGADDEGAESGVDRERAEKVEAIEHGEICRGDDDVYSPSLRGD